jgi:DNA invertase Pin-like site-specific DNA recombinase
MDLTPNERRLIEALRAKREAPPVLSRPPRCFIYVRWSHVDSSESGLSKDAQLHDLNEYVAKLVAKREGPLDVVEPLVDEAVRAFSTPFPRRPAGSVIWQSAQPGDVVIVQRMDRAFRNIRDMTHVMGSWAERGIEAHFVKEGITYDTATGRLVAHLLAGISQFYSELLSERNKEIAHQLRLRNRPNGMPRIYERYEGERGHKIRVVLPEVWWDAVTIYVARERRGGPRRQPWRWSQISDFMEALEARREGRDYIPPKYNTARTWSPRRCGHAHSHITNDAKRWPELAAQLREAVNSDIPLDVVGRTIPPIVPHGSAIRGEVED